jgi:hypothetical protein
LARLAGAQKILFTPAVRSRVHEYTWAYFFSEGICQNAALLIKYSDGTALTDEEKKRVQQLQKNAQQRKHRCKDTALLNKYYKKMPSL